MSVVLFMVVISVDVGCDGDGGAEPCGRASTSETGSMFGLRWYNSTSNICDSGKMRT